MNKQITVTNANMDPDIRNERLDAPVYEGENLISAEHDTKPQKQLPVSDINIDEVPTISQGLKKATPEAPRQSLCKKRTLRRSRSFTCSAKDFVPRRTDDFCDRYHLGQLLGEGAFGEVFVCYHQQTGDERAVKIIHKDRMLPSEYDEVVNEFQLLKRMDHPNVIRMYEFYDCRDKFYIVQELAKGGELYDELEARGSFPEDEAALLIKQVLSCLKYLHANGVVHRDLNLENILLDSNKDYEGLKIIDFGLATTFQEDEKLTEIVGKTHYLAPEVLEQRYGPKYDVWSTGVMAYILLSGFAPFDADQDGFVRELIMEGRVSFDDPEWNNVSDDAKDFVAKLLTYEEDSRPTAEEALRHPWIARAIKQSSETFRKRHSMMAEYALSNMRSFSNNSLLKQAACSFIASQLVQKEEREELDRIFRGMDSDCDGRLSISDLQTKYKEFSGTELTEEEISSLFHHCDMSGTGYIDFSEFVIASMRPSDLLDEKKLRGCFDHFDVDKTGFISAETLKESLSNCRGDGDSWTDEVFNKIIREVDNGNGQISFQQFREIMAQDNDDTDSTDVESVFDDDSVASSDDEETVF